MFPRVSMFTLLVVLIVPLVMAQEPVDQVMGNWEGKFTSGGWESKTLSAKIVAEGKDSYRALIEIGTTSSDLMTTEVMGIGQKKNGAFCGIAKELPGAPTIIAEALLSKMAGKIVGPDQTINFEMGRVEKKSPTLGAPAPQGAVALLEGNNLEPWKIIPGNIVDGVLHIGGNTFITKQEVGDHKLHVEFRTPFMPNERGQARGNSGVYVQGRYEVQVLDSFGLPAADNECGGIYKKAVPKVNACLPPMEWQTYDITFYAPKFNDSGKKTKDAEITVEQNGIVIHDHVKLDGVTPGGVSDTEGKTGPLLLQNHGNPVQYRNLWIQPL
ncbi:MAG: DUF1080 domain-containing protein [Candidatus Hydrogenedentes bacterium]|nr:DUF1080 domain-containing protein [Candidatus Hydrogenedentota bacterium]